MAQLEITVLNDPQADLLARNLVQDISARRDLGTAKLQTREAGPGEKGIVEIGHSLIVTVLESGGGLLLADIFRNVLGMTPSQDTTIMVKGDDGRSVEIKRKMSQTEFEETRDALVAILKPAA